MLQAVAYGGGVTNMNVGYGGGVKKMLQGVQIYGPHMHMLGCACYLPKHFVRQVVLLGLSEVRCALIEIE